MFPPWAMLQMHMLRPMRPYVAVKQMPAGAFPVPQTIRPDELPPAVQAARCRLMEGPPKPAVTLNVMNETQKSMIGPDLPFKADV